MVILEDGKNMVLTNIWYLMGRVQIVSFDFGG